MQSAAQSPEQPAVGAERQRAAHLRSQAERCRRLARGIGDLSTRTTLLDMAEEYDGRAQSLALAQPD